MYIVIMAGGKGTRFWPRSRAAIPKQLLDIISDRTMIQETFQRVLPLVTPENILVVTNTDHADHIAEQLPAIPKANIIAEPFGRNTAACICLAATRILSQGNDDAMLVLPADHYILDEQKFRACLQHAGEAALASDALITIGIVPRSPETGYGYIQYGNENLSGYIDVFKTERFHEKPDLKTAEGFVKQKNFLWNSGMFIWKASVIMHEFQKFMPELHNSMVPLKNCWQLPDIKERIINVYEKLPSLSIDYGVMEKAQNVYVIKGDFGWNDIGTWSAIYETGQKDRQGNITRGEVLAIETHNSFVFSQDKLVALVGLQDIIVVESGDAILVCSRDKAQDVKKIVDELERTGRKKYL